MTPEQTEFIFEEYVAMNQVDESGSAVRAPLSDLVPTRTATLDPETAARLKAEMKSKIKGR